MKRKECPSLVDDLNIDELEMVVSPKGMATLLKKLRPDEQYKRLFYGGQKEMERYIKDLQEAGLDIGKGNVAFGYKMPLPEKNKTTRDLIIFRRY